MNGRSRLSFVLVLVVLLAVAMLPGARAQEGDTPAEGAGVTGMADSINFQGRLLTSGGGAVTPGSYLMKFSLCSDSSCGAVIWGPYQYTVTVDGSGLFSVLLAPLSATYFGGNPYLKTEVCTTSGTSCSVWDTELAPQPISSVALAVGNIRKNVADSSSASSTGYVLDVSNTGTGGALHGSTSGPDDAGVKGENANPDGSGSGVWGVHALGIGVRGTGRIAIDGVGTQCGVAGTGGRVGVIGYGVEDGVEGSGGQHGVIGAGPVGVSGRTNAENGIGVHGTTGALAGTGVKGENDNPEGNGYGVWGVNAHGGTGVAGSGLYGVEGDGTQCGVSGTGGRVGVLGYGVEDGVQGTGGEHGVRGDGPVGVSGRTNAEDGIGVHGTTGVLAGTGVKGENTNPEGNGYGVWGANALGIGVKGTGIRGTVGEGTQYGVVGTGDTAGVLGYSGGDGVQGTGVKGESTNGYGVHGTTSADLWTAVYGHASANAATAANVGVAGQADGTSSEWPACGVFGYSAGYAAGSSAGTGVYGKSESDRGHGVAGHNTNSGVGVGAWSWSGDLYRGYSGHYPAGAKLFWVDNAGNVYGKALNNYSPSAAGEGTEYRTLHGMTSAESWSEDFSTGTLVNGEARIEIEAIWAQTVNLDAGYRVFFTPLGDCAGLYVAEKGPSYFIVRELQGGQANIEFDYRIVAHPRGQESGRLEVIPAETFTSGLPAPARETTP